MLTSEIAQAGLSLLLILLLIFLLSLGYKKFFWSKITQDSLLKLKGVLNLGLKEKLAVVQCGKKYFLIGITSQQISFIHCFKSDEIQKLQEKEKIDESSKC